MRDYARNKACAKVCDKTLCEMAIREIACVVKQSCFTAFKISRMTSAQWKLNRPRIINPP